MHATILTAHRQNPPQLMPGETESLAQQLSGAGTSGGASHATTTMGDSSDEDVGQHCSLTQAEEAFVWQREDEAIRWYRRFLRLEGKPLAHGLASVFAGALFMDPAELQAKQSEFGITLITFAGLWLFVGLSIIGDIGTTRPYAVLSDYNSSEIAANPDLRVNWVEEARTLLLLVSLLSCIGVIFRGLNMLFICRSYTWQAAVSPRQDILQAYNVALSMAFLPLQFLAIFSFIGALVIAMLMSLSPIGAVVAISFWFLTIQGPWTSYASWWVCRIASVDSLQWIDHQPTWMKSVTSWQFALELGKDYRAGGLAGSSQSKLMLRQLKHKKPLVYKEIVQPPQRPTPDGLV